MLREEVFAGVLLGPDAERVDQGQRLHGVGPNGGELRADPGADADAGDMRALDAERAQQVDVEEYEVEVVVDVGQVVLGGSPAGLEGGDHAEAGGQRLVQLAPARNSRDGVQQQERRTVARLVEMRRLSRRRQRDRLEFGHQLTAPTGCGVTWAMGCGDQWSS